MSRCLEGVALAVVAAIVGIVYYGAGFQAAGATLAGLLALTLPFAAMTSGRDGGSHSGC